MVGEHAAKLSSAKACVDGGRLRLGKQGHWLRNSRTWVLALLALALAETSAHFFFRQRAPSAQQWQHLSSRVASLFKPGDLVVVAPDWGEPLARQVLGDAMMPLSVVARAGDDDYPRAIQIGFLGQARSELSGWTEIHREIVGKFELSIRHNPAFEPSRYRLIDHVDPTTLSVALSRNGVEQPCPFNPSSTMSAGNLGGDPTSPKARFNCAGGSFHWVGVTIIDDERYRPRRCIWAPTSAGAPLTLRFRLVSFGKKLVGHAGAPWLMVRDGVGPPITLTAASSRGAIGSVAAKDTDGWIRFEWRTDALENTTADLELTVAGSSRGDQRFCFTLESR